MNPLDGLNARQKEAVLHTDGPLLIVAGAGAGKTRVITHRILHLIRRGAAPESILAITFTNKAAKEMRDRVAHLLNSQPATYNQQQNIDAGARVVSGRLSVAGHPWIGTFHALGVQIIRENSRRLGIEKHFTIFDKGDSLRAVKEALKRAGHDPKSFEPGWLLASISREKGNAVTLEEFRGSAGNDYLPSVVAKVWTEYEQILRSEKALDFDDLLLKTALLLQKEESVRKHYHNLWRYIHIDEYQDTNRAQYLIAKLLADANKNIAVVGDADQCLLPNTAIETPIGVKKISEVAKGEAILGAAGNGMLCDTKIDKVRKRYYDGEVVELTTAKGKKITATPRHMLFARLTLSLDQFYVYLMYRRDKGFRVGMAKSVRRNGGGQNAIGLLVRCNQEKADKMWVLKICTTKQEALYFEAFFGATYGIPTLVFMTCGRKMAIEQTGIDRLFASIDTKKRAETLFADTGLSFDYPHYFPQGTTQSNTKRERLNVRLSLFGDRRKSLIHPWGMSRVSINTTADSLKRNLEKAGFRIRKGKRRDFRFEVARLDYGKAEQIASRIVSLQPNMTLIRNAFLTKGKNMLFQPISNIFPGMTIAHKNGREIGEDTVTAVERKQYRGDVYDLDVRYVHNYIANDIVVHNCIYSWRGAHIRNLLGFEKDYPKAKVVLLEENYRSTQTILAAANQVIEKNKLRREKTLITKNAEGEKIGLFAAYDEADEAAFASLTAKRLIEDGTPPREIAVLFRANFQSRALEEAFMNAEVPYQVLGIRFFERKEVKDVVSYVRAALRPESLSDMKRIANAPPRGLGKVTLLKLFAGQESSLPRGAQEKVRAFRKLLETFKEKLTAEPLSVALKWIVSASGLEAELKKGGADDTERLENIRELVTFATRYDIPPAGGAEERETAVNQFLADAALQSDQDELKEEKNAVRLMTVHASKGLEFDHVFITGLEQDLFPHSRFGEDERTEEKAEEERRLFYVALTRARKKIFLTYANARTIFGARQVNLPSEFIFDIDEELLQAEAISNFEYPISKKIEY